MLLSLDLVFKFFFDLQFIRMIFRPFSKDFQGFFLFHCSIVLFTCERYETAEKKKSFSVFSLLELKMAFISTFDTLKNLCLQEKKIVNLLQGKFHFLLLRVCEWTCMRMNENDSLFVLAISSRFQLLTEHPEHEVDGVVRMRKEKWTEKKFCLLPRKIFSSFFMRYLLKTFLSRWASTEQRKSFNLGNLEEFFRYFSSLISFLGPFQVTQNVHKIKSRCWWSVSHPISLEMCSDIWRFCWNLPQIWFLLSTINILFRMTWNTEFLWMKER